MLLYVQLLQHSVESHLAVRVLKFSGSCVNHYVPTMNVRCALFKELSIVENPTAFDLISTNEHLLCSEVRFVTCAFRLFY